jgi:hypothetical protein
MERIMLGITLLDKIRNTTIREKTRTTDTSSLLQKTEVGIRRENCQDLRKLDDRRFKVDSFRKTRTRKTEAKMGGRNPKNGRRKLERDGAGQDGLD